MATDGLCIRCGNPVFTTDHEGYPDDYCGPCEDALIARANEDREWQHFHPGEPCPEIEKTSLPPISPERSER